METIANMEAKERQEKRRQGWLDFCQKRAELVLLNLMMARAIERQGNPQSGPNGV